MTGKLLTKSEYEWQIKTKKKKKKKELIKDGFSVFPSIHLLDRDNGISGMSTESNNKKPRIALWSHGISKTSI